MIGIIGAMDEEVALLVSKTKEKEEILIANCVFIKGKIEEKEVVILKSGIGKVNAAMATTILHEKFNPSHVINTGSAGGFSNRLEVGDIVISTEVVHHDVDVTAFNYAYGQVPGMPAMFPVDTELAAKAIAAVQTLPISYEQGIIATGDSFMDDAERVAWVKEKFPSMIAAEMEAAAIAQVCHQYNTPFVIIRALSDIAGKESSITFDAFLQKAAENAANLILSMLKSL
ncbi:5'-methylthioadenosine/S-adenosylhomocysteine nucleosidase [Virgibacillus halodenitrificans]|jgi:adenosylhomocysteine nucleosidase|uniref:5'-methylthioadenosine/S-adenosylhomocysteine nucleosidase n=1 Tax=Virgibacillus halodenitrificans TaxID=1482 RepID=UPI000760B986|nr:5'-methylthioadenosine/S-adenosylhomocysteine nucleosidase [Virgibacillus halodenitrificans]MCG1029973.1 5'-methylthioadenosine/S-adenosylhomocysteine nucleosidase [Virgibacillus halodenitrificans]MCJ0930783.1 5'-methylthioadenosine/S-adenosylhomocysteine nucleosidase [Virgibacillus halodenitrificans]MYL46659.1 5'-methylthioadenosine/S-adenosylhomocysteine nucleosidase [Virgibacillus halodenitrificans]MYL56131.1 5'-methylthioadenosine/S-adenosylhomocysteine nucleosidase [Virgibacillus halode